MIWVRRVYDISFKYYIIPLQSRKFLDLSTGSLITLYSEGFTLFWEQVFAKLPNSVANKFYVCLYMNKRNFLIHVIVFSFILQCRSSKDTYMNLSSYTLQNIIRKESWMQKSSWRLEQKASISYIHDTRNCSRGYPIHPSSAFESKTTLAHECRTEYKRLSESERKYKK